MSRCVIKAKDPTKEVAVGIEIPNLGGRWFLQVFNRNTDEPEIDFETNSNAELLTEIRKVGVNEEHLYTRRVLEAISCDYDPGPHASRYLGKS